MYRFTPSALLLFYSLLPLSAFPLSVLGITSVQQKTTRIVPKSSVRQGQFVGASSSLLSWLLMGTVGPDQDPHDTLPPVNGTARMC